uniref:Uncharacterized protein n=1 Tax=Haemonchus contortus TaxID=6289 RepID=W6NAS9_HAECO
MMNLLSCLLTLVILYYLWKGLNRSFLSTQIERQNSHRIDKSANRVSIYILLVSALMGVVPGGLNGLGTIVHLPILDEISFFVGTCATLSGLSHAFIFAMAHRDIKQAILTKYKSGIVDVEEHIGCEESEKFAFSNSKAFQK